MDKNLTEPSLPTHFNKFGEAPLRDAPSAVLKNGKRAIPQQFFHYQRTVHNVEQIINLIEFSGDLPIYVFEENGHVFLQIGVIGHENYPMKPTMKQNTNSARESSAHNQHKTKLHNDKIVYGRRWYIEPHTPTSEVIQTVFLAINKVREHEIREVLTMSVNYKGKQHTATPFNSHLDLPLAAQNSDLFSSSEDQLSHTVFEQKIREQLQLFALGHCKVVLKQLTKICTNDYLFVVCFEETNNNHSRAKFMNKFFPELIGETISFTSHATVPESLHSFTHAIIKKCEAYVSENFTFNGFNRFSHQFDPQKLAEFSLDTRLVNNRRTPEFDKQFSEMVRIVDGGKAPKMAKFTELSQKQIIALQHRHNLEGFLPQ